MVKLFQKTQIESVKYTQTSGSDRSIISIIVNLRRQEPAPAVDPVGAIADGFIPLSQHHYQGRQFPMLGHFDGHLSHPSP